MTFQIFPNRFKNIGVVVFLICFGIPILMAFFNGFSNAFTSNENQSFTEEIMTSSLSRWLEILSLLGMLLYMLSKEKVEDDYINKLRLESFQLTTIIGLVVGFIAYLFNHSLKFSVSYFIFIFLLIFLITFSIKKRSAL